MAKTAQERQKEKRAKDKALGVKRIPIYRGPMKQAKALCRLRGLTESDAIPDLIQRLICEAHEREVVTVTK